MPITLGELATRFDCDLVGDADVVIDNVAGLHNAGPGSLSFLSNPRLKEQLSSTKAAAVVLRADDAHDSPVASLVSDNPYAHYALMAAHIHPAPRYAPGIHASAVVSETASVADSAHIAAQVVIGDETVIGEDVYIGPNTVVGPNCTVDNDCRLIASVTLVRQVALGARSIIHPGVVIGADGFGNAMTSEGWVKVPQVGGVRIGDDVEIGACTSVDCGAIDDTVIENGVRIDNQIQIGHNVHLGEHTAVAASAAIAGSARIGKRCLIAGLAGIAGHIEICDDVTILGKGMVSKSINEPGAYASNFPVEDVRTWNRRVASFRRLDKLLGRVSDLEKDNK